MSESAMLKQVRMVQLLVVLGTAGLAGWGLFVYGATSDESCNGSGFIKPRTLALAWLFCALIGLIGL